MRRYLSTLAVLSLALTATYPALAQPKPGVAAKKPVAKKAPKYEKLLKSIEETYGKPLTEKQKTEIRAAAKARSEAIKPIQEKFRSSVAKSLGLTQDQFEAKIKAQRKAKDAGKKKN